MQQLCRHYFLNTKIIYFSRVLILSSLKRKINIYYNLIITNYLGTNDLFFLHICNLYGILSWFFTFKKIKYKWQFSHVIKQRSDKTCVVVFFFNFYYHPFFPLQCLTLSIFIFFSLSFLFFTFSYWLLVILNDSGWQYENDFFSLNMEAV